MLWFFLLSRTHSFPFSTLCVVRLHRTSLRGKTKTFGGVDLPPPTDRQNGPLRPFRFTPAVGLRSFPLRMVLLRDDWRQLRIFFLHTQLTRFRSVRICPFAWFPVLFRLGTSLWCAAFVFGAPRASRCISGSSLVVSFFVWVVFLGVSTTATPLLSPPFFWKISPPVHNRVIPASCDFVPFLAFRVPFPIPICPPPRLPIRKSSGGAPATLPSFYFLKDNCCSLHGFHDMI